MQHRKEITINEQSFATSIEEISKISLNIEENAHGKNIQSLSNYFNLK